MNMKKFKMLAVDVTMVTLIATAFVSGFTNWLPLHYSGWRKVIVEPGDSLWSICEANCPQANTEDVIGVVCARDHIGGNQCLQPGQVLYVPTQVS